ncbi:MAG: carbohydrate binding family 9 domain-containing protein [Candidatus Marinimicrobia bacterium]|nr:carbohydrate binding family 9 domain-containing protein [FCB group bacterium]MBL7026075.1 carbohydrate binding family 9 domain-containing protein [Candidatus Neomarinimicrobiota bacterium]
MKYIKALILGLLFIISTSIAEEKKSVFTTKTSKIPTIDGRIEESVWETVEPATDFYRFEPESGGHAPVKTEIRILYDDVTFYVAAKMFDLDPSSIAAQLGKRDDDDVVADWIGLWINPFNDGANELIFMVTSAGVQVDRKTTPNSNDSNWNPVWESAARIDADGWSVEMAIPFSQMRFPAKDIQIWGFNIGRYRTSSREMYTWTLLDKEMGNYAQQVGLLKGIQNLETPLRLSFTPYASVSSDRYPVDQGGMASSTSYRGGMDLQYGINESFTLDMTLIPDFGQVQSDNIELNLSPFEIQYNEHRPFFTEGTQLLQKAGLFYSRRVGSKPVRYWQVADEEILEQGESIKANPDITQLINATKVTGQTVNGLGLGFFNAITAPVHAVIEDSLGGEREYLTNPATNYNLIVVSKNLQNGSEFSVTNSNVLRFSGDDSTKDFNNANVTGYETRLYTSDSKWRFQSSGAFSYLSYPDSNSTGHHYFVRVSEVQGVAKYGVGYAVESEFYNPNDLGFLRQANEVEQYAWVELQTINPVWKVNDARIEISGFYAQLFNPRVYTHLGIRADYNMTFKNYYSMGGGAAWNPREGHDYYETRVDDRYFTTPKGFDTHLWLASNYTKPFSMSGWAGISAVTRRGSQWRGGGLDPRWRINNQFMIQYGFEKHYRSNNHGFADFDANDDPIFGKRDHITTTNTIYTQYIVSRNLESDIRFRHYRSTVEYKEFFDLMDDGNLSPSSFSGDLNTAFNALTIDAVMTWRFAPGSELTLAWKNAIYSDGDTEDLEKNYFEDLQDVWNQDQSNSISLKLLYYVDSWALRHRLK